MTTRSVYCPYCGEELGITIRIRKLFGRCCRSCKRRFYVEIKQSLYNDRRYELVLLDDNRNFISANEIRP